MRPALKLFAIFFFKINPDEHVSTKVNAFTFYKEVFWGYSPTEAKDLKKNGG